MNMLKHALLFATYLTLGWFSIGCAHGQVTPAQHTVVLTWTAPANPVNPPAGDWQGCGTPSTCTYVISRASATPCLNVVYGATGGSVGNYTPLNQATPVAAGAALTYTDASGSGPECYIVQTLQAGEYSLASNTVGPFAVPANPGAPVANTNATVAADRVIDPVGDQLADGAYFTGPLPGTATLSARLATVR